jgi:hypothetical protein
VAAVALALALWHPLHTTITTIAYDPASAKVTATVRVFQDDLSRAIGRQKGVPITPGETSDADAFAYLKATVAFASRDGKSLPLTWCGARTTGDLRWLCVETTVPTGPSGLHVRNSALAELFDDQVNVVMAEYGGRHESLLFTRGDGAKSLP